MRRDEISGFDINVRQLARLPKGSLTKSLVTFVVKADEEAQRAVGPKTFWADTPVPREVFAAGRNAGDSDVSKAATQQRDHFVKYRSS